jgi:hypothetical protein
MKCKSWSARERSVYKVAFARSIRIRTFRFENQSIESKERELPTPWSAPIRAAKQLTIFPTKRVTSGAWAKVFTQAVADFNALSGTQSLGVTFVVGSSAPDPSGVGGADVQFDTINGAAKFTCFNQVFSDSLSGVAMEGHTQLVMTTFGTTTTIAKAFIFVPATPKFKNGKGRVVGDPGKLVIAAHELIHACGLSNSDHSSFNNGDLFNSPMMGNEGSTPAKDTMTPFGLTAPVMPPIVLAAPTIALIQNNW